MSNLSDFLGGSGGGFYLGYIETADGSFEKIADGAGVAVVDLGSVFLSNDGVSGGYENYISYSDGLWVKKTPRLTSFASPSSDPRGLTFDSSTGNLISCDATSDMIYVHNGVSSTILTSFASPGAAPSGLTFDSLTGNLISCDFTAGLIYVHAYNQKPYAFLELLTQEV